ncbi:iron uptake porin [Leptolyngbya sp. NIES-2104]|uniref:iron uptake porin n=1 Tax=Leptolyngbya sp. NIES-2104 TaxID=1552121 RepID=UPI0006EC5027|nr:iron uptake porin [Leptolyngbya sp. NIES-2104]GAP98014.1 major outer membrane protein [Leptolyngbya sp. NIES-2104]
MSCLNRSQVNAIPASLSILLFSLIIVEIKTSSASEAIAGDSFTQVTGVDQLSDVQSTDWAFQALRSLIDRYGCLSGSPNQTFRGNRALTRYEFAAGLNSCLNRINELVTASTSNIVSQEDLATLQRLQAEYSKELTVLRGRVDQLEARTATLEKQQFSTTTKLTGQVVLAANAGGFRGERILDPTGRVITNTNPNPTVFYRAALDFDTSFSGQDLLKLRLDSLSARGREQTAGFLEPNFGSTLEYTVRGTPNQRLGVSRLYYAFNPVQDLKVTVGSAIVSTDFVDRNRYANKITDFSTLAFVNNDLLFPINAPSVGAALDWSPAQSPFKLRAVYLAADAANPDREGQVSEIAPFAQLLVPRLTGRRGLFGAPYQGTIELEYAPSQAFSVRLQYSGGKLSEQRFDVFGVNVELALSQQVGLFGRYGYSNYDGTSFGNIQPNYWMAGIAFQDLLIPKSIAGLAVGQPFIENAVGDATQTNIEAFYNLPLNDNISLTPLIQIITHPGNQDSNGTIVTGTLRTVFSF